MIGPDQRAFEADVARATFRLGQVEGRGEGGAIGQHLIDFVRDDPQIVPPADIKQMSVSEKS